LLRPLQTADLLFRTETLVRQNLYRLALRSVFREVRDPMTSDGLTGLYSYGFLYEHLSALIDDAKECEKNLSVGFFDMEGIAHVNRTNGYVAGDKVLRQIGSLIGNLVRGEDLVARHGGDQFCVLMPGTTLSEAEIVLRRIAGVVTNTEYAVREAQDPVQVTMKAGYAAFEDGDDAEGLVARARHRSII
jgi:two-component system cell cycle response regulator